MHAGSLQFRRLAFTGGNWTIDCPHPLGNIIQFHELLSGPKDLSLTRHENALFYRTAKYRKTTELSITGGIGPKSGVLES